MKAAVIHGYGGPDVFRIEEVPEPVCGPSDVLIRVKAAAVNPVDTKLRRGFMRGVVRYRMPWILGLDVSGVVEAVGERVTRFSPGDEVYASPTHRRPGCYAELTAIEEKAVARKPKNVSHEEAAGIPMAALTAWASLVDPGLQAGQRVLVQAGAGGVGSISIQLAKHLGAHVAATCSTRNIALVESLGADEVIDYTTTRYEEVLTDYDGVVDALGGEERRRAIGILRRGGFVASLNSGMPEASKRFGPLLGPVAVVLDNASLTIGAYLTKRVRIVHVLRKCDGATLEKITTLVEEGVLKPIMDRVLPLEQLAEAHAYSETGRATGKIVIAVT